MLSNLIFASLTLLSTVAAFAQTNELNENAQILAGVSPSDTQITEYLKHTSFASFVTSTNSDWNTIHGKVSASSRLDRISKWSSKELGDFDTSCKTLLYAFGGPDILNAQKFFPSCNRYVMFGLKKVGTFPNLISLLKQNNINGYTEFNSYLAGARESQKELFRLGFMVTNITRKAQSESKIDGHAALIAFLLIRGGNFIENIEPFCLTDSSVLKTALDSYGHTSCLRTEVPGVKIQFRDSKNLQKEVLYIRTDLSDGIFKQNSTVYKYLQYVSNQDGVPFVSMLKAASYLMHKPGFVNIRKFILDSSQYLLQDDSGIPFRFLDQSVWNIKFYGNFSYPIKLFKNMDQPALRHVYYPNGFPGLKDPNIELLPFNYGYNFYDSSLMALRKIRN
jgi:hypothetical protein